MRCLGAQRTCGGYEDGADRVFRQYEAPDADHSLFKSSARKCSLPVRTSLPGSDALPEDGGPKELTDENIEDYALRAFLYNFCVVSVNRSISRGFLHGLEPTLHRLGPQSDLAKACKAVFFASHGTKLCRPSLTRKAERLYQDVLESLAEAIQHVVLKDTVVSLMIAMLLGFYEVLLHLEMITIT